jgi:Ca2+-binding RTX toxin-like protein
MLLAAAAAALPAAAGAATIHASQPWRVSYGAIDYTAGAGETNNISFTKDFNGFFRLDDPTATILSADLPAGDVYCLSGIGLALCKYSTTNDFAVSAILGDGDDSFASGDALVTATVDGGPGNDRFSAGISMSDFNGGPGADDFHGGRADYSKSPVAVTVTMDDVADDGALGEGDNVHSDAAGVFGSVLDDTLTGSAAANDFFTGAGDDHVSAGAGRDNLFGDLGDDVLDGGPGYDLFLGGPGDDLILARDVENDYVVCGTGNDTVEADPQDTIDSSCETVDTGS